MAHVGKFYKLHFRRDLCPTFGSNRLGLADAYMVNTTVERQAAHDPGSATQNNWLLTPDTTTSQGIRWTTKQWKPLFGTFMYLEAYWDGFSESDEMYLKVHFMHQGKSKGWLRPQTIRRGECRHITTLNFIDEMQEPDLAFWVAFRVSAKVSLLAATWSQWDGG